MFDYIHLLVIPLVLILIVLIISNNKIKLKANTVRMPKGYYRFGIILFVLAAITTLLIGFNNFDLNTSSKVIITTTSLLLTILSLIVIIIYLNYEIYFFNEKVSISKLFAKTVVYNLDDIKYESNNKGLSLFNKDEQIVLINHKYDNYAYIIKNIKTIYYDQTSVGIIKGSIKLKNLQVISLLLALAIFIFGLIFIFIDETNNTMLQFYIIFISIILFVTTIYFNLHLKNLKVIIMDGEVTIVNPFGRKQSFKRSEISYKLTKFGKLIYHNDKKITYLSDMLLDRPNLIFTLTEKK